MENIDIKNLIEQLDSYVEEYSHDYTTAQSKVTNFELEHGKTGYTEEEKIKYNQLQSALDYFRDKLEFLGQVKEVLENVDKK